MKSYLNGLYLRRSSFIAAGLIGFGAAAGLGQVVAVPNPVAIANPSVIDADVKVPSYEVVSVKPHAEDKSSGGVMHSMTRIGARPDGVQATNASISMLLQLAYGIKPDLISGLPGWADSARYDVEAKVAEADVATLKKLSGEQRRAMMKPLLAERFKLAAHIETKILPVYELVVAKGGPKLKEAVPGATYENGIAIKGLEGAPKSGMMMFGAGMLTGQGVLLTSVVQMLSQEVHRTVIDKTGLMGKYDISLKWTPQTDPSFGAAQGGPQRAEATDDSGPSVFAALQEQLGLRLQPAKGPVDTLVVDHVEKPSEN